MSCTPRADVRTIERPGDRTFVARVRWWVPRAPGPPQARRTAGRPSRRRRTGRSARRVDRDEQRDDHGDRGEQRVVVHAAGDDRGAEDPHDPDPDARDDRHAQVPPRRVLAASTVTTSRNMAASMTNATRMPTTQNDRRALPHPSASRIHDAALATPVVITADSRTANAMPANPPSSRALPSTALPPAPRTANIARTAMVQRGHRRDRAEQQHDDRDDPRDGQAAAEHERVGIDHPVPSPVSIRPGSDAFTASSTFCPQLVVVAQHGHEDRVADGQRGEHREQRRVGDATGQHPAAARTEPRVRPGRPGVLATTRTGPSPVARARPPCRRPDGRRRPVVAAPAPAAGPVASMPRAARRPSFPDPRSRRRPRHLRAARSG